MSAPPASVVLALENVSVRYGEVQAVHEATFELEARTIAALVGPSGCGKTSLLRSIAGFEVPSAGTVTLDGRVVAGPGRFVPPEEREVGLVFQQGALFPHLTVRANVGFGVRRRAERYAVVERVLALVGLTELEHRYPDELSGGQQQRVALARALAPSPRLILLDEPFASLDAGLRQRVRDDVIAILRAAGATALLVTHDQDEALSVADRLAVMGRGRILQVGAPEEIYRRPVTAEVAELIGDGQLLSCSGREGRLASALGAADCAMAERAAWLLVRPEDVALGDPASRGGVAGTVERRRFFGHDRIAVIRLDSGETILSRDGLGPGPAVGARVRVGLRARSYPVFASTAGREALGLATPHEPLA